MRICISKSDSASRFLLIPFSLKQISVLQHYLLYHLCCIYSRYVNDLYNITAFICNNNIAFIVCQFKTIVFII